MLFMHNKSGYSNLIEIWLIFIFHSVVLSANWGNTKIQPVFFSLFFDTDTCIQYCNSAEVKTFSGFTHCWKSKTDIFSTGTRETSVNNRLPLHVSIGLLYSALHSYSFDTVHLSAFLLSGLYLQVSDYSKFKCCPKSFKFGM